MEKEEKIVIKKQKKPNVKKTSKITETQKQESLKEEKYEEQQQEDSQDDIEDEERDESDSQENSKKKKESDNKDKANKEKTPEDTKNSSKAPSSKNNTPKSSANPGGTGTTGGTTGGTATGGTAAGGTTAGGAAAGGTAAGGAAAGGTAAGGAAAGGTAAGGAAAGGAAAGGAAAGGAAAGGAAAGGAAAGGAAAGGAAAGGVLAGAAIPILIILAIIIIVVIIAIIVDESTVDEVKKTSSDAIDDLETSFQNGTIPGDSVQIAEALEFNENYLSYIGFTSSQIDYLYEYAVKTNGKETTEKKALIAEYKKKYGDKYFNGTGIVSVDDSREIYKHILNTEKYNFNNITWVNYNHDQEGGKEIAKEKLKVDQELGIRYPNDSSMSGEKFMEMTSPYLLNHSIPLGVLTSSILNANSETGRPSNAQIWNVMNNGGSIDDYEEEYNQKSSFAYQIIKHAQSDVTIDQYQLKHYTLNTSYLDYVATKYQDEFTVTVEVNFNADSFAEFAGDITDFVNPKGAACYLSSGVTTNTIGSPEGEHINTRWDDNKVEQPTKEDLVSESTSVENVYYVSTAKAFDVVRQASFNHMKYSDESVNKRTDANSEIIKESEYYVIDNESHKVDQNSISGKSINQIVSDFGAVYAEPTGEPDVNWENKTYKRTYKIVCGEYVINKGKKFNVTRKWDDEVVPGATSTRVFQEQELFEFNETTEDPFEKIAISKDILSAHEDMKYYKELVSKSSLNAIDILDSNPMIYSKYLATGEQKSKYIGYGKDVGNIVTSFGYENVNTLLDQVAKDNKLPFIYGISLGYDVPTSASGNYMASSQLLKEYLRALEGGGATTEKDGKLYYTVLDVLGHPTVGYGLDLVAHPEWKTEIMTVMGVDSLNVGDLADVEICDKLEDDFRNSKLEKVKSMYDSLELKEYQIHALVTRTYNVGNVNGYGDAHAQYYNAETDDKYEQVYEEFKDNQGAVSQITAKADKESLLYKNYMSTPVTAQGVDGVVQGLVNRRNSEWHLFSLGYYDKLQKFWTAGGDGNFGGISVIDASGNVNPDACLELQVALQNEIFSGTLDAGGIIPGTLWHNNTSGIRATTSDNTDAQGHLNPAYSPYFAKVYYYQCPWWSRGRANIYLHSVDPDKFNGQYIRDGLGNGVDLAAGIAGAYNVPLYTDVSQLRANCVISYDNGTKCGHTAYVEAVGNDYYVVSHCGSGVKWHGISIVPKTAAAGSYRIRNFVSMDDVIQAAQ